jgi:hypothetical protein
VIQPREALAAALVLILVSGCEGDAIAHVEGSSAVQVQEADDYPHLIARIGLADDARGGDRWLGDGVELHQVVSDEDAWMEVVAQPGGGVRQVPGQPLPLQHSDRATLLIRAEDASADAPVEVELAFYDAAHGNRFWRPLSFEDSEWHELDIDLAHLRYDRGTIPRWEDVTSWGLVFRTAGTIAVRGLVLWQDGSNASPYLTDQDLRKNFPAPSQVRFSDRAPFVVLTDEPKLDLDNVLDALTEMDTRMRRRFPDMPTPDRPVPLLVFSTEEGYRSFWKRFAEQTGSGARPLPEDEGYTWMGIATAWYSDEYGPVRPTYVHEASHALLERSAGLAAQRSWLFEGLGVFDQLEVSRQDLRPVYSRGLRRTQLRMPLEELISGDPIPTSRYWQATLFMEWILVDPERTAALGAALEDMRQRGSADLRGLVVRHFGLDLPTFTANFWEWAAETYGR